MPPDFEADGSIRYTHRMLPDRDVYFVANRTNERVETSCTFRVSDRSPDLWNPLDGTIRPLPDYTRAGGRIQIPLQFEPYQSYFVVFRAPVAATQDGAASAKNFPVSEPVGRVEGPWNVMFDKEAGGPGQITLATA